MGRYVDLNKVTVWRCPRNIAQMREWVFSLPVEDVKPITHAHNESDTSFMCSNCTFADFGLFNHGGKYEPKYCPNCGAKMDEDEEVSHD